VTTILLTGMAGQVGRELASLLPRVGCVVATGRRQLDLTDPDSIRRAIRDAAPSVIVNAAGYTAVDDAESEQALAIQVNGVAPGIIAEEAKRIGALLVHYSTHYVYAGGQEKPYVEEDPPGPLNVYGKSKLEGERAITAVGGAHLILRTSWIYSTQPINFVQTILKLARERQELRVVEDQTGSPTWARELAKATVELLRQEQLARQESGIYHLSATGHTTRFSFAKRILEISRGLSHAPATLPAMRPVTTAEYPLPAARPINVMTSQSKIARRFGVEMPPWEAQLEDCLRELLADGQRARSAPA